MGHLHIFRVPYFILKSSRRQTRFMALLFFLKIALGLPQTRNSIRWTGYPATTQSHGQEGANARPSVGPGKAAGISPAPVRCCGEVWDRPARWSPSGLPALRCSQRHGRQSAKGWEMHSCRNSSAQGAALAQPVGSLLGTWHGPQTGHCPR